MMRISCSALGISTALLVAAPAMAATTVDQCGSGNACQIQFDGTSGTFSNSNVTNVDFSTRANQDRYFFDVASNGKLSLTLTTTFTRSQQDINFSLVQLNPPAGGGANTSFSLIPTTDESYRLLNFDAVQGQYAIVLRGMVQGSPANASYAGTINFSPTAAVPEIATWGMMIAGFGMMGVALRRRRTSVAFA